MLPLLAVVLTLVVPVTEPIVRRADRPDSAYCALGSRAASLASIGRAGDGTLVGSRWVLTAGHVAHSVSMRQAAMRSVRISGINYPVEKVFVHPGWTEMGPDDIGLLYLDRAVSGVKPMPLYRESAEKGRIATLLGHGKSGTGAGNNRLEDGKARGATSRVDSTDTHWLYFSFDAPPAGTNREGAPGDSGGPA